MDFEPSEEQRALAQAVERFGRQLSEGLPERDRQGTFDRDLWRRCGEFGILGLPVPEAYGGSGQSLTTTLLAMEALGRGCSDNGLVFSLNAQMWAVQMPLLRFGSEALRRRHLPPLCRGERVGAHAMTEPGSGSDAMALSTRAVREGDGYVLEGTKTFVTNGPVADLVLVFATVDPSARAAGVTAFLVERGTPGMSAGRHEEKMGLRASSTVPLVFDGCEVPDAARLGAVGEGFRIALSALDGGRIGIGAQATGTIRAALDVSARYARERTAFGVPIAEHQAVTFMLADMATDEAAARLLTLRAAYLKGAGQPYTREASEAKLFASEAAQRAVSRAVQIHGGYGFVEDYPAAKLYRDARVQTNYAGTSEIQRLGIAREILRG